LKIIPKAEIAELTLQHASGLPLTVTTRSTDGSVSFFVSIYIQQPTDSCQSVNKHITAIIQQLAWEIHISKSVVFLTDAAMLVTHLHSGV